jgi:hypothetical protein
LDYYLLFFGYGHFLPRPTTVPTYVHASCTFERQFFHNDVRIYSNSMVAGGFGVMS